MLAAVALLTGAAAAKQAIGANVLNHEVEVLEHPVLLGGVARREHRPLRLCLTGSGEAVGVIPYFLISLTSL